MPGKVGLRGVEAGGSPEVDDGVVVDNGVEADEPIVCTVEGEVEAAPDDTPTQ